MVIDIKTKKSITKDNRKLLNEFSKKHKKMEGSLDMVAKKPKTTPSSYGSNICVRKDSIHMEAIELRDNFLHAVEFEWHRQGIDFRPTLLKV